MYQVTQESQYNKTMVLEQLKYCHNSACVICSRILLCQIRTATLFTLFASLEKWALFLQHTTIFYSSTFHIVPYGECVFNAPKS